MEWMRCNACWLRVGARESASFHLTQCGHIFCDKCIGKAEERCCQCGSMGTISLPLKDPLSPQIAHYFTPLCELIEKSTQAQQFQQAQLDLCLKRADENENKYQTLKEAYWASAENLKKVYQKYQKLKSAVTAMQKNKMNESVTFTPAGSQYHTPPQQINSNRQNNVSGSFFQHPGNAGFRVPSSTRVPRTASSGYYTASSRSNSSSVRN